MPLDDDDGDDLAPPRPPLPPDDRLWRHPSELHQLGAPPVPALDLGGGRRTPWTTVVVAGLAGAVLAGGILAVTGVVRPRVVERHVVEKVAVTPVVSTPVLAGGTGVEAVARRLSPAIVRLDVERGEDLATGSGVIFRDDGMVLTSAHVVAGADAITAQLADGQELSGRLVGVDELTDVAVVDLDADDLPVAVLGTAQGLEVGAPAIAIGSALGLRGGPSVTTGVISALERSIEPRDGEPLHGMLQTDAPIAPGSSGGALVDASGAVVGIVTAVASDASGRFGFATPIDLAHRVANDLIEEGRARHGWLGVHGTDLTPDQLAELGLEGGALVRRVADGGPAARAGLEAEDVITQVDGEPIHSMPALVLELRERKPGDRVTVGYVRDGRSGTARVTIGDRSDAE